MKGENLKTLQENGLNVPKFLIVYDDLDIDLAFSTKSIFAVRSSADIEDNSDSSCAGLFDSFLNVPKNELREKIDLVRESYSRNGVSVDNPVIIQEMVDSDISGVLFTANPLGVLNEMVIVVGKGLGNGVVEDKVNTTTYCFNVDDELYDYSQIGNSPLLSEMQLRELIEIGKKIESIFNKKMDIEFAIENGEIFVLQARPITTISEYNLIIFDNSNIGESYQGF